MSKAYFLRNTLHAHLVYTGVCVSSCMCRGQLKYVQPCAAEWEINMFQESAGPDGKSEGLSENQVIVTVQVFRPFVGDQSCKNKPVSLIMYCFLHVG